MTDKIIEVNQPFDSVPTRFVDMGDGSYAQMVYVANGVVSAADRELVVSTYRCKTAFSGASVGDTITATQVIDVSGATPATVSTIWRNQTTAADLASAPSAANLELTGSAALTAAQLASAGLALDATVQATNTALGADGATPPVIPGTGVRGWLRGIYEKLAGTLSITAVTLPLPTGASTAAYQLTANNHLSSINTKTPALGQTTMAASQPVTIASDQSAVPVSGAVSVSNFPATQPVSAASLPLPTGAATEATLAAQNAKMPSLMFSRTPVVSSVPNVTSATVLPLTTSATGATYVAFASTLCSALDVVNNTGTTVEYVRGGTGTAMPIPSGSSRMVLGITNANQISMRRTDTSNTSVNIQAEAFVI